MNSLPTLVVHRRRTLAIWAVQFMGSLLFVSSLTTVAQSSNRSSVLDDFPQLQTGDWPWWRGPQRNGIGYHEKGEKTGEKQKLKVFGPEENRKRQGGQRHETDAENPHKGQEHGYR